MRCNDNEYRASQKTRLLQDTAEVPSRKTANRGEGGTKQILFIHKYRLSSKRQDLIQLLLKVYTVANESVHLIVFGVPKIKLQQEIKSAFQRYGGLLASKCVTDEVSKSVELEQFTDVFHIKFQKLEHARRAKRFMDAREFYGGILHISYAPEYETTEELRNKLLQRQREINYRTRINAKIEEKKFLKKQL